MTLALLALVAISPSHHVVQISIDPSATGPKITALDSNHTIFIDPDAKPTRGLLVFLPGTGGVTTGCNGFCTTAAEEGYQVINLMYPNAKAAAAVQNSSDEKAFANFRWEIVEGRDLSAEVNVNRANSIENRLIKVLEYLDKTRPNEGWGAYLKGETPQWEDITLAGISQGAGHAALIATRYKVKRVISLGGPKDYMQKAKKPAAWYKPCATPADRIYTFNHKQDAQAADYPQQLEVLKTMGLYQFGGPVDVDDAKPPYKNTRILVTNYPGTKLTSMRAHASVVADMVTPKTKDGDDLFKPVWHYMLTNPSPMIH